MQLLQGRRAGADGRAKHRRGCVGSPLRKLSNLNEQGQGKKRSWPFRVAVAGGRQRSRMDELIAKYCRLAETEPTHPFKPWGHGRRLGQMR